MSYSYPIGASTPLSPLPPDDAASDAEDTTVLGGGDDFTPQFHEIDPPYCPGEGNDHKPHRTPHPAGILHPALTGTQVGSEG